MTHEPTDPFANAIVTDPWSRAAIDVPGIHKAVFDRCLAALENVRRSPNMPTASILIYGAAGSGKTHLLGRLCHAIAGPQSKQPANFCYVRLATSPAMICRHVRRCLANDLLRPDERGISQLDLVLLSRLCKQPPTSAAAAKFLMKLRQSLPDQRRLSKSIKLLDEESQLGRNFATACEHHLLRRHRRDVGDWFREGELPDAVRAQLGFVKDPIPTEEDPEHAAYDMVLRWTRLVGPLRPLVLCFDQIEAIETGVNNAEGLASFGRFIANVYNDSRAVLFITCAQSAFQKQINRHIRGANFARVAAQTLTIDPITLSETQWLAAAILNSTADLAKRQEHKNDRFWPVGLERLGQLCQNGTCTPRQLIAYCSEVVSAWRSGKPIPHPSGTSKLIAGATESNDVLHNAFEERRNHYLGRIEDTQTTLAHGLPQLAVLIGRASNENRIKPDDVDFVLKKGEREVLVSVCNQKHSALSARLKRLQDAKLPIERLALVRDGNLPIPATSKVARQRWQDLQNSGARVVRPTVEALAALEALRSLLSDAKAGDLSKNGMTLEPRTVEEWVRSHLLDEELERLMAEVMHSPAEILQNATGGNGSSTSVADAIFNDLLEAVQKLHVASVESLAATLKRMPIDVIHCAANHSAQFGLIGAPPTVVFEKCVVLSQESV